MLSDPEVIQDLIRRFREMNPELMALPSSHQPKHGMGFLGRPFSPDRLKLERIPHNLVIDIYKREGLIYSSKMFGVSRWAMTRNLKRWGVALNGGYTPDSLQRFSQAMIIIRRSQPRQIARSLKADVLGPLPEYYPYLIGPPKDEHHLVLLVNQAVPKGLRNSYRSDICQELLVALLEHQIEPSDLPNAVPEFIKRQFKQFPTKYGPLSLDAPLAKDGNDFTLIDKLHDGNIRQRW